MGDARGKEVSVLAGAGGNGGGALVAARRLHDWGANVEVALMRPADAHDGASAHQLHIAQKIGIRIVVAEDEPLRDGPEVILDGMVGYSPPLQNTVCKLRYKIPLQATCRMLFA